MNRTDPPRAHDKRGLVRTACPLFTGRGAFASGMTSTEHDRRLDVAATVLARGVRRVLGVEVGRIAEVSPEGDRVRVAMDVREDTKIPRNASAIIVPISLISDRYVQLSPVWREGPQLRDGDEIPLERGVAPRELDDLLATLKRFLEAVEPGSASDRVAGKANTALPELLMRTRSGWSMESAPPPRCAASAAPARARMARAAPVGDGTVSAISRSDRPGVHSATTRRGR